jgi:hypothetical protein
MAADIAVKLGFNLPERSALPLHADVDENEGVPAPLAHSLAMYAVARPAPSYEFEDGSERSTERMTRRIEFMVRPTAFMVPRSPTSLKFSFRTMGLLGIAISAAAIIAGAGTFALFKNNNSDLSWLDKLQKPPEHKLAARSSQTQSQEEFLIPEQGEVRAVASGSPTQRPSRAASEAVASGSPSRQLSPEELAEPVKHGRELFGADTASPLQVDICSIVGSPAKYDHQTVTLQGTATALKETTSHRGNDYTTFKLQDPSGCGAISVFSWGHAAMSNGDNVRVEGVFETEHHQGRYTFNNEVEATKVTSAAR